MKKNESIQSTKDGYCLPQLSLATQEQAYQAL